MTLLLYGTALRDLHDDGMCPPVKGVNMRRKQNACDSNGGVHAERVTANMHDLTYGLKDFSARSFLIRMISTMSAALTCVPCHCWL